MITSSILVTSCNINASINHFMIMQMLCSSTYKTYSHPCTQEKIENINQFSKSCFLFQSQEMTFIDNWT